MAIKQGINDPTINKKRARSPGGGWKMMCERRGARERGESIVFMALM
jgi:hypothetical protein